MRSCLTLVSWHVKFLSLLSVSELPRIANGLRFVPSFQKLGYLGETISKLVLRSHDAPVFLGSPGLGAQRRINLQIHIVISGM